jgi:protein-S-isoprenylcysteine O-methyltransferase Ste14
MNLLKTLLFTVLAPGTVAVYIPWSLLVSEGASVHPEKWGFWLPGALCILLGASIYCWCAWDFTFAGHGTPAPIDAPKELVVRGLYRFVRNPMYIGIGLLLIGEALLFQSTRLGWYAAAVLLAFHLFILLYEEPTLRRKFGASYQDYCSRVPRWIPRRESA